MNTIPDWMQPRLQRCFESSFMGKLRYLLQKSVFFGKFLKWSDDNPKVLLLFNVPKFHWSLVPFLTTERSPPAKFLEELKEEGFSKLPETHANSRSYSHGSLSSTSTKQLVLYRREHWIRAWMDTLLANFHYSYPGQLYAYLNDAKYLNKVSWSNSGERILVHDSSLLFDSPNGRGAEELMRSYRSKMKYYNFMIIRKEQESPQSFEMRHVLLTDESSLELWVLAQEEIRCVYRIRHRLRMNKVAKTKGKYLATAKELQMSSNVRMGRASQTRLILVSKLVRSVDKVKEMAETPRKVIESSKQPEEVPKIAEVQKVIRSSKQVKEPSGLDLDDNLNKAPQEYSIVKAEHHSIRSMKHIDFSVLDDWGTNRVFSPRAPQPVEPVEKVHHESAESIYLSPLHYSLLSEPKELDLSIPKFNEFEETE